MCIRDRVERRWPPPARQHHPAHGRHLIRREHEQQPRRVERHDAREAVQQRRGAGRRRQLRQLGADLARRTRSSRRPPKCPTLRPVAHAALARHAHRPEPPTST
eukprot:4233885-Prymnesium_polylepis.1